MSWPTSLRLDLFSLFHVRVCVCVGERARARCSFIRFYWLGSVKGSVSCRVGSCDQLASRVAISSVIA